MISEEPSKSAESPPILKSTPSPLTQQNNSMTPPPPPLPPLLPPPPALTNEAASPAKVYSQLIMCLIRIADL